MFVSTLTFPERESSSFSGEFFLQIVHFSIETFQSLLSMPVSYKLLVISERWVSEVSGWVTDVHSMTRARSDKPFKSSHCCCFVGETKDN